MDLTARTPTIGMRLRSLLRRLRRPQGRAAAKWPSAEALSRMSDTDFESFIRSTGINTVSTARIGSADGRPD